MGLSWKGPWRNFIYLPGHGGLEKLGDFLKVIQHVDSRLKMGAQRLVLNPGLQPIERENGTW